MKLCGTIKVPTSKLEAELRRLREWIARARAKSQLVELPSGPAVVVPAWFMHDGEFGEIPVDTLERAGILPPCETRIP